MWELRLLKRNEWTDKRSTRNAVIFTLHAVMSSKVTREQVVKQQEVRNLQLLTIRKVQKETCSLPSVSYFSAHSLALKVQSAAKRSEC